MFLLLIGPSIVYLVKNLFRNCHFGTRLTSDHTIGFEWCVDADLCKICGRRITSSDSSIVKSKSGWIIIYVGWPAVEYTATSFSLWDIINTTKLVAK